MTLSELAHNQFPRVKRVNVGLLASLGVVGRIDTGHPQRDLFAPPPRPRFMVCKPCLQEFYGGGEKSCSHGWDLLAGKPRSGPCGECGQESESLHCPDAS